MAWDKKKHFLAGLIIATACFAVCLFLGIPMPGGVAFAAAALAGIGKEAYDATGRGKVEVMDALATAAAGVPFLIWGFYG